MSDRLKLCYIGLGLIWVLLFIGCSPRDEAGFLVPVMRSIPWEEGIGKAALGI